MTLCTYIAYYAQANTKRYMYILLHDIYDYNLNGGKHTHISSQQLCKIQTNKPIATKQRTLKEGPCSSICLRSASDQRHCLQLRAFDKFSLEREKDQDKLVRRFN